MASRSWYSSLVLPSLLLLGSCSSASDPVAVSPTLSTAISETSLLTEEQLSSEKLGLLNSFAFSGEVERLPRSGDEFTGFWTVSGQRLLVREQTDLQIDSPSVGDRVTVTLRDLGEALALADQILPLDGYIEEIDGDLSDDRSAPTLLPVGLGSNRVTATQQGNPRDIDFFTFTVPQGTVLSGILLQDYDAGPDNLAFLGLQEGDEFTVNPNFPLFGIGDLLGGLVFGVEEEGTDISEAIGSLPGTIGFSGDLPSGDYTFWLNQTGEASTYTLDLQITAEE